VEVFELPSGERRLSLMDENGVGFLVSPGGSCLASVGGEGERRWRLRELPSGRLMCSLPKFEHNAWPYWSPDGRHFLFSFNPGLSVYRADTGECVGRFEINGYPFAFRPDGSAFVALLNDSWGLLAHSFDRAEPDTIVPLPGKPAYQRVQGDQRPADSSVWIEQLATTNDGSAVFTFLYRYRRDGDKNRRRRYLARWDRSTHRWSETDMGPDAEWSGIHLSLRLDGRDRYVATRRTSWRFQLVSGSFESDHWGEEEAKRFDGRNLWDARSNPPRCLSDDGFLDGTYYFDPNGRRLLSETGLIYDAETRAPIVSKRVIAAWQDDIIFSADGRWLAFPAQTEPWHPSWAPDRVADWVNRIIRPADMCFDVVRLADGKMVRQLFGRTSPTLTTDGHLWTVTERDRTDDTVTLIAERWSPESLGPPWWLMLLTVGGCVGTVWLSCRGPAAVQ
jgi:hypothetical protein